MSRTAAPPSALLPRNTASWNHLDRSSALYGYFVHLFYGGEDLTLEVADARQFVREFVEFCQREGVPLEPFDVDAGLCALHASGHIHLYALVEELVVLVQSE
ncbi:hypothetical protein SPRG_15323 [Saprolegnia parasitica CBS 223.65]|uniref:Uncharacterized protein n=1 Tax=Saprolegnia parasitica (strain CBS 223.65) TaxID=695850 RepID=A0A067BMQ6_SAPPC|nr:hypothetical protein SPRG_15323 [Saprolegnia parasitica CBS 223.65]KDO19508.1 hypothetical protein SPRG_15323 [Saprolegnia parasitica CBS 223.65]|eukprot:XP_012209772.1 hypothetical protein SPRG_15323 [Saprolegnia parasitica CBS 223.65]